MQDIKKRRSFRVYTTSVIGIVVLAVVCVFVWRGVWGVYQKEARSRTAMTQLEREHTELTERYNHLEERVALLQTEEGVEKEMREKFDVVQAGEQVVVVVDPVNTDEDDKSEEQTWWEWMKATIGL